MIRKIFCILLANLVCLFSYTQPTQLVVGNTDVCPENEVLVPVDVSGFNDIAAFTLFIGYDTTTLDFIEHVNENPETQGIYSNAMSNPDLQIGLSWSSLISANIGFGKLVDLKFHYKTGNCDLVFNAGCELVNSSLEVIEIITSDGAVTQSDPVILGQPSDLIADEGESAFFSVEVTDAGYYQWQISSDAGTTWNDLQNNQQFAGVDSDVLQIAAVPCALTGSYFRCLICKSGCCIFSEPAFLTVIPAVGSDNDPQGSGLQWNVLFVSPGFLVKVDSPSPGIISLNLTDLTGRELGSIARNVNPGKNEFLFDEIPATGGIFICKCMLTNGNDSWVYMKKILKIRDN